MRGKFLSRDTAFLDDMFPRVRFSPSASTGIMTQPVLQQFVPHNLQANAQGGGTYALGHGAGPSGMRLSRSF